MVSRRVSRLPALLIALALAVPLLPAAGPAAAVAPPYSNWQPAVNLSFPAPNATQVLGSFFGANDSVREFYKDSYNGTAIIYTRYAPGSTGLFGPPSVVDSGPVDSFVCTPTYSLPDGRFFLFSDFVEGLVNVLRLVVVSADGTAAPPQTLSPDNGGYLGGCPRAVVDPDGTVVVSWRQTTPTFASAWARIYAPTSGWGNATLLENEDLGDVRPTPILSSDGAGNFSAVWVQLNGTAAAAYAAERPAGGSWSPRQLLHNPAGFNATSFRARSLGSGKTLAVWNEGNSTVYYLWSALYDPAKGGWQPASLIDTSVSRPALRVLAPAGDGGAAVLWTVSNGTLQLWSNVYTPSLGWSAALRIDDSALGSVDVPSLIQCFPDTGGSPWCFWSQINTTFEDVVGAYLDPGSGWQAPVVLSTTTDNAYYSSMATYGQGNGTLVWTEDRSAYGYSSVFSRSFVKGYGWTDITPVIDDARLYAGVSGAFVSAAADGALIVTTDVYESVNGTALGTFAAYGAPYRVADPPISISSPADGTVTSLASIEVVGKTEPGLPVAVNGLPAVMHVDGSFNVTVPVVAGNNTLTAVASHPLGFSARALVNVVVRDLASEDQRQIAALVATLGQMNATLAAQQALVDSLERQLADLANQSAASSAAENETQAQLAAARAQLNVTALEIALARGDQNATALALANARADLNATRAAAAAANENASKAAAASAGAESAAESAQASAASLGSSLTLLTGVAIASLAVGVASMVAGMRGRRSRDAPAAPAEGKPPVR